MAMNSGGTSAEAVQLTFDQSKLNETQEGMKISDFLNVDVDIFCFSVLQAMFHVLFEYLCAGSCVHVCDVFQKY